MDQWQSILERFLRNECSENENKIVYHALRNGLIDDLFCRAIDDMMNEQNTAANDVHIPDNLLKNIRSRMKKQKERYVAIGKLSYWLRIAAVALITLSVSWLVFHAKPATEPVQSAMNTIHVPAGQNVKLTLSDGTNIWLNARTTLKYPSAFTGNKREIILEGEGFFDVAHNHEKPFVVRAGGYDILALGTQFNVEAYTQNDFTASLLEGSVQVTSATDALQTLVLLPNTVARLYDGHLISENITDFDHYRWREGLISFKGTPFNILMAKFEKCYGIKIVVENNRVKDYAPTGKFRQSDGIDYALRVLQRNFKFRFERDEENHVIYIK